MAYPFERFEPGVRRARLGEVRADWLTNSRERRWKWAESLSERKVIFEPLEPRYLLSADLMPLTVDMVADGDELTLSLDTETNNLQVLNSSGELVAEQSLDDTSGVVVTGSDNDDSLAIDYDSPFTLIEGIHFAGGLGNDKLIIQLGRFNSVHYGFDGSDISNILLHDGAATNQILVSGLESLTDFSMADDRLFVDEIGGDQAFQLSDDGDPGNDLSMVDISDAGGSTAITFANPDISLTLDAAAGDDDILVGDLDANLLASVSLEGGAGNDTLGGGDTANTWIIDGIDSGTLNALSFTGSENLVGGSGDDSFVIDSGSVSGGVDGGAGTDNLVIQDGTYQSVTYEVGGTDTGSVSLDDGVAVNQIDYAGLESVTDLSSADERFFVDGTGSVQTIRLADDGDSTNGLSVLDDGGSGGFAPITFANPLIALTIDAGAGDDTIIVGTLDQGLTAFLSVYGGTGNDTLVGPDGANIWIIDGIDSGTLTGIAFEGIENLLGGAGDDIFTFLAGGSISGVVDGGGGTNTLDYESSPTAVTVDLGAGSATGTGGFANVQVIVGGAGNDTIIGGAADTLWRFTGGDTGLAGDVAFTGFENVGGGAGIDTFIFDALAYLGGLLTGGLGSDILMGPDGSNLWTLTGADEGTLNGMAFTEIEDLVGGALDDELVFTLGAYLSGAFAGGPGNARITHSRR